MAAKISRKFGHAFILSFSSRKLNNTLDFLSYRYNITEG